MDPKIRPLQQKKRHFGPERSQSISEEVDKLLAARMIREVQYPTWLANPGWMMCVDYIDLNKACPNDCYPLPRIDILMDSAIENKIFCFLDGFKGYHQIIMSIEDQEKTVFIIDRGVF